MTLRTVLAASLAGLALFGPEVRATDFSAYPTSHLGCSDLDDGRIILSTCYDPGSVCDSSSAYVVTAVPGTFTFDLVWDVTGAKDHTVLECATDSGGLFFMKQDVLFQDTWCDPAPCGGTDPGVTVHVEAGDTLRFWLWNSGEPCFGSSTEGTRCIFENLTFVPDPGIHDLGRGLDRGIVRSHGVGSVAVWGGVGEVEALGDLDGDSIRDYAVSHGEYPGDLITVEARSGASGAVIFSYEGSADNALGEAIADVGDVDGDGVPDVAVGEPEFPPNYFNDRGRVRVLSGVDGSVVLGVQGVSDGSELGTDVAGLGDIDGDLVPDFAAGAEGESPNGNASGRVYALSGADGSVIFSADGDQSLDYFGERVAGIGDVDGDGLGDLAAASIQNDAGGSQAGLVRVISGTGAWLWDAFGTQGTQLAWGGLEPAGDVNNDGVPDVLIGAPFAEVDGGPSNAGRLEVRSGDDGSLIFLRRGNTHTQYLGYDVIGVGDTNGDGFVDVATSDYRTGPNGQARIYGGPDGQTLATPTSGNHTRFADVISAAGDVDGDGLAEVRVHAIDYLSEDSILTMSAQPGLYGPPTFGASGALLPDTPLVLDIAGGRANAGAILVLGLSAFDLPFKNGLLTPSPDILLPGLVLDGLGAATMQTVWPEVGAPATVLMQVWIFDQSAASGFIATNALSLNPS